MQRMTIQRRAILRTIETGKRPLSPEEVLSEARGEVKGLSLATVYRSLNALLEDGRLTRVALLGKPPRYELAGLPHHHHFVCDTCDRMFDLPGCSGPARQRLPRGFKATGHEVVMFGRCRECAC